MQALENLRIPGVIWVIILLILGIGIQAASPWIEAQFGIPAWILAALVTAIFLGAKRLAPGGADLNKAIDLVEILVREMKKVRPAESVEGMRSAHMLEPGPDLAVVAYAEQEKPARPNPWARVLVG